MDEVALNARVLFFCIGLSVLTGVLFGILPALRLSRIDPQEALRAGSDRLTDARGSVRLRGVLVGLEVALSAVLLIVAGLLTTSFFRLANVDKGFALDQLGTVNLRLPGSKYPNVERRVDFYDRLLARVETLPGVRSAALTSRLPLQGEGNVDIILLPGDDRPPLERPLANVRFISADYFDALDIRFERGRTFEERDRAARVAILSKRLAETLWPGMDSIGRGFFLDDGSDRPHLVVGVTADTRSFGLGRKPGALAYFPYWEQGNTQADLIIRSSQGPSLAPALRAAVWEVDAEMPVPQMKPMDEVLSESIGRQRFQSWLASAFAIVALVLASVGIYGVISQAVNTRVQEIGLRMALGAARSDILSLVVKQGMLPSIVGILVGTAGAMMASRVLSSLLFGVSPTDAATFAGVPSILLVVALLACYIPARRATRVDPMVALRDE